MHKHSKTRATTVLAFIFSVLTGGLPHAVHAADGYEQQVHQRSAGAMAVDAVAIRPLGIVATVIGTGLFVVSLPFSALGGNVGEAADALVVAPAKFTFTRPLGEYDSYR